jgi:hypothetical protein
MAEIQYDNVQSRKLKEQIFRFMEENCFAIIRIDTETVIYYNGLKICKNRNVFSVKDTNEYHEIDNLFLLKLVFNHVKNAVKSKEVTETT